MFQRLVALLLILFLMLGLLTGCSAGTPAESSAAEPEAPEETDEAAPEDSEDPAVPEEEKRTGTLGVAWQSSEGLHPYTSTSVTNQVIFSLLYESLFVVTDTFTAEPVRGFMKLQTDKGEIRISSEVFTYITGAAATNCYGVKGMAIRSKTDGLVHLLRRESMSKGVKVIYNDDDTVSIQLHIIVDNGVNLMAVSRSIMSEVRYIVSRTTGVEVKSVDVCVDSMVIG